MSIGKLKQRARSLALYIASYSDADCGTHLLEHINPEIAKAKAEFQQILVELAKVDPNFPKVAKFPHDS